MSQQPALIPCPRCGFRIAVVPQSPYEFAYRCACGAAGVISWAHAADPPRFDGTQQGTLFDARSGSPEIIEF